jgi:hypothetical protein
MALQYVSDDRNTEWEHPPDFEEVLRLKWLLDIDDGPNVHLLNIEPGGEIDPHFQEADQWIVVVDGRCSISNEDIRAIGVHYSKKGTPYGPIIAGRDGAILVVLRERQSSTEYVEADKVSNTVRYRPNSE